MQTWAKRGIQTALVTGGLLMLGTGIASADEDVNPDLPPSALDATITVPIHLDNNVIGTPLGQVELPSINRTISVSPSDVIGALPGGDRLLRAAAPVADGATEKLAAVDGDGGVLRGNKVVGDLTVPIDISGNAIALGGDAEVENTSSQTAGATGPIVTDGSGQSLAGNVVALDWAAPVQITGNALALVGNADVVNVADQSATAGGDLTTSGNGGVLGGNVGALHGATPIQLNGNAIAGAGNATTDSTTSSTATSGGVVTTDGTEGVIAGNAAAVPVAAPVHASGQAISLIGIAEAVSDNSADAQAGAEAPDFAGNPTYVNTYAPDAVLSGNILQPATATPVVADCTSAAAVGISDATCTADTTANAGGGNRSDGSGGVISGAIGTIPVAAPIQAIGNAAGAIGNATSDDTNTVSSDAGGHTRTRGHDSVLGGALVNAPVAGPVDVCGSGVAGAGDTVVSCDNTTNTQAGGDAGTTGDDSVGGGNGAIIPVAIPVESIGNGGGALGSLDITGTENKSTSAGGDSNTADDGAVLAANLVHAPLATPVQVFGNAVGAIARTKSTSSLENATEAGGESNATGIDGVFSGNIAQAPGALPVQVFGANGVVGGIGSTDTTNATSVVSGSTATTDGSNGTGSGNIVSAPIASAVQAFGDSVAVLGKGSGLADNLTVTEAGGSAATSGESGSVSGNVVNPALFPVVQSFGTAVAGVAGQSVSGSTSQTVGSSGGDITTNGDDGFLSGNLFDIPAAVLAQPHGDAVGAVASQAVGISDNTTTGTVGGHSETSGDSSSLSGLHGILPVGIDAPIYDVPVEVLADAVTNATHVSDVQVGEETPQLQLPAAGALPLTKAPTVLGGARSNPIADLPTGSGLPLLGGLLGGGTGLLGGLSAAGDGGLIGGLPTGGLAGRADRPTTKPAGVLPTGNLAQLPTGALADLPTAGLTQLPTGGLTQLPTGGVTQLPVAGLLSGGLLDGVTDAVPGRFHTMDSRADVPAMPGLDAVTGVFAGDLFEVPEVHTLPATDVSGLTSLTDTQSKLADLFGTFPKIG